MAGILNTLRAGGRDYAGASASATNAAIAAVNSRRLSSQA
jgi:hypothetical protein